MHVEHRRIETDGLDGPQRVIRGRGEQHFGGAGIAQRLLDVEQDQALVLDGQNAGKM
jgi:hypothetical protein